MNALEAMVEGFEGRTWLGAGGEGEGKKRSSRRQEGANERHGVAKRKEKKGCIEFERASVVARGRGIPTICGDVKNERRTATRNQESQPKIKSREKARTKRQQRRDHHLPRAIRLYERTLDPAGAAVHPPIPTDLSSEGNEFFLISGLDCS